MNADHLAKWALQDLTTGTAPAEREAGLRPAQESRRGPITSSMIADIPRGVPVRDRAMRGSRVPSRGSGECTSGGRMRKHRFGVCHRCGWTGPVSRVGRGQRRCMGTGRAFGRLCDDCIESLLNQRRRSGTGSPASPTAEPQHSNGVSGTGLPAGTSNGRPRPRSASSRRNPAS